MKQDELPALDLSEDEIKEQFKQLNGRPVCRRTISVGKCIGKTAQRQFIKTLKSGLIPVKVGSYYVIKAEVLESMLKNLDENNSENLT